MIGKGHWRKSLIGRAPICGKCAFEFGWIELFYEEEKKPCLWCDKPTNNRNEVNGEKQRFDREKKARLLNGGRE